MSWKVNRGWTGTRWDAGAIFSRGGLVHLFRPIIAAAALSVARGALAQGVTTIADGVDGEAPVETVRITGNWLGSGQQSLKTFGGARSVIKRESIWDMGAASVSDVLRSVPGLQIIDNSSSGGSAISLNVGVRGLEGRYTHRSTVLLDGIPLALAPYGQPQLSFAPVSLANLEAIDVVRGGGAVRYGPQNVGGIINFKTRAIPAQDTAGDASLRFQKFDGGDSSTLYSAFAGARADGGLGVALLYAGLDGNSSRRHGGNKVDDVALKFSCPVSAGAELFGKLGYFDGRSSVPGGLTAAQFAQDAHQSYRSRDHWSGSRSGLDLGYVNAWSDTREVEIRGYYNESKRESVLGNAQDANVVSYASQPRDYTVLGLEPRYTGRLTWGRARNDVTLGYRFLRERSGERSVVVTVRDGKSAVQRWSAAATDAHALYLDDQVAIGRWRVTPGLRYEYIALKRSNRLAPFDDAVTSSKALPSVNVSFLLDQDLTLYGNYNSSFGSIQHLELNLQNSTDSLRPETARTRELGARYVGAQWQAEATVFSLDFSNQIVFVNTAPLFYKNLGQTLHQGLETRAEYRFDTRGALAGLYAYATYSYTKATQREGAYRGDDVPFYSRTVDTQGLRYRRGHWTVDVSASHQSRQYADEANTVHENAAGNLGVIGGYRLWNANVSWAMPGRPGTELQVGINNLGNKLTFTRTSDTNLGKLPGPARMAFLQIRMRF